MKASSLCLAIAAPLLATCSIDLLGRRRHVRTSTSAARRNLQVLSPCAQVAELFFLGQEEGADEKSVVVETRLANACLQSIPVNVDDAKAMLEYVRRVVSLQSNIAYIKDPSLGKIDRAPWDVLAGLDRIESNVVRRSPLINQYRFERAVARALNGAQDYHLMFVGALFRSVRIRWIRDPTMMLVSASPDGVQLPRIYLSERLRKGEADPVVLINGEPAEKFLASEAVANSLSDRHSRYQYMFHLPQMSYFYPGEFVVPKSYPGAITSIKLQSGVEITGVTTAVVHPSDAWDKIRQGVDPYEALVKGEPELLEPDPLEAGDIAPADTDTDIDTDNDDLDSDVDSEEDTDGVEESVDSDFPDLEERQSSIDAIDVSQHLAARGRLTRRSRTRRVLEKRNYLQIYVLANGEEVAVMQLATFRRNFMRADVEEWQAKVRGKRIKRLIIDLQSNFGGWTPNVYAITNVLYDTFDFGNVSYRFRSSDPMRVLARQVEAFSRSAGFPWPATDEQFSNAATGIRLQSWAELYGPYNIAGDQFSAQYRASPLPWRTMASSPQLPMFLPENIAIFSNSVCGSACAIFVEHLTRSPTTAGGIKLISAGGLPETGPSQVAGGIKGGPLIRTRQLDAAVAAISRSGRVDAATIATLPQSPHMQIAAAFNAVDMMRDFDNDKPVPAQFVFDASHCRVFYSREMLYSAAALYQRVYDAAWGEVTVSVSASSLCCGLALLGGVKCTCGMREELCVAGSFNPPLT